MSDIEKRKELSEEEKLEKGSIEEEKKGKKFNADEKEGSQSADQGSVTNETPKSVDETQEDSPRSEKTKPDQEKSSSIEESPNKGGDHQQDDVVKIHQDEDLPSHQNTASSSDHDSEGDSEESKSKETEKNPVIGDSGTTESINDLEAEITESDLKTSIAEIEEKEKESDFKDQTEETVEKEIGEPSAPDIHEETIKSSAEADRNGDHQEQSDSDDDVDSIKIEANEADKEVNEALREESAPPEAKFEEGEPSSEAEGSTADNELEDQPEPEVSVEKEEEVGDEKDQSLPEAAAVEGEEDEEEGDEVEEEKDFSTFSKEEIIHEVEEVLKVEDMKKIEREIKKLKPFYDDIYEHERIDALQKFLDGGGSETDFIYAGDALDSRFSHIYDKYKTRRNHFYANLDKEKDTNLQKKHEVLEKLRSLVDGEETTTSIGALKEIQKEWKEIGPVPNQYAKSLWATYNILIDRFYDNRSIYFELKELDRKKNLEGKLDLCERAEELAAINNIKEAVKELNELHEEFKHIGPVPKEVQEEVWQRFKAASDAIYAKRKEFVGRLKKDLNENLKLKMDLVEEVGKYNDFDSDKISDWNEKTKEILDIQKKWESIGGLPREHAKEINKSFWSNFKFFFNNKNKFFKKLEGQRDENLKLKEGLVNKAELLQESEEWDQTAETLKELQKEWKNIGPVPEKFRNDVYKRFKSACDTFFDRRRSHSKDLEGDYRENLTKKEKICEEIEDMVEKEKLDTEKFKKLQLEFDKIGYVPRNTIRKIQKKYDTAVNRFLETVDLPGAEKSELKFAAEINRLKSSPNSDQKIHRKESELRRMISKLENDIALWRNNLEFFAESKTADKLREEFSKKIEDASTQLDELKEELKVLNKID